MNSLSLRDYYASLDKCLYPIERGYMYQIEDVRLGWLFQNLQSTKIELKEYKEIFGNDLLSEYNSIWHVLSDLGWININSKEILLLDNGIYFTPLIQTLLASERNEELRRIQKESF